jgi:hypothetical protein
MDGNRMGDYNNQLAHSMFVARCQSDVDQFFKFIGIAATMDLNATPPFHHGHVAT